MGLVNTINPFQDLFTNILSILDKKVMAMNAFTIPSVFQKVFLVYKRVFQIEPPLETIPCSSF